MEVTEDIKQEWLNVIRHLQAACHENGGFARVRIDVVVKKNVPVMWTQAKVDKVHPIKLTGLEMTPSLALALGCLSEE